MAKNKFIWGTATAAYQVEGSHLKDDKGLSVWDSFVRGKGKVSTGDTGDVACDHYNRYAQDLELMSEIGVDAYRFSISWPRVIPEGVGKTNSKGLDFYDRLVDKLLDFGISPWITLFHWDYPLALYHRGGWLSPDSPYWFREYTDVIVKKLGDRVSNWITLNEPNIFVDYGHRTGLHAPGLKLESRDLIRIVHHTILAHGLSIQSIRANSEQPSNVGVAMADSPWMAPLDLRSDRKIINAVKEMSFSLTENDFFTRETMTWCEPIFLGKYPDWIEKNFEDFFSEIPDSDFEIISNKIDFCGLNVYNGKGYIQYNSENQLCCIESKDLKNGFPTTHFGWPITPEALYWSPKLIEDRYNIPTCITENGMSSSDWPNTEGEVRDEARIRFLESYIGAMKVAIKEGVDVRAYFHWSFMDNFEWAEGYSQRFGLVHVDFNSQKRTKKKSADWYSSLIKSDFLR